MILDNIQNIWLLPLYSAQFVSTTPVADHTILHLEQGSQVVTEPITVSTMWGGQKTLAYRTTITIIVLQNNFDEANSPEKLFEPLCGKVLDELTLRFTKDKSATTYLPAAGQLIKASFKKSDGNGVTLSMKIEPAELRQRLTLEARGCVQDITKLFSPNI